MQKKELEKELKLLYKKLPEIQNYMKSLGCDKHAAEDIFQEALLIYMRKRQLPEFVLTVPAFFYVRNTCKLLWYNEARKKQNAQTVEFDSDFEAEENDWIEKEMRLKEVENVLAQLGKKCQELLQLFYAQQLSLQVIAVKIGLRNDHVVKAQKYRCLQRAKELLHTNPNIVKSTIY